MLQASSGFNFLVCSFVENDYFQCSCLCHHHNRCMGSNRTVSFTKTAFLTLVINPVHADQFDAFHSFKTDM